MVTGGYFKDLTRGVVDQFILVYIELCPRTECSRIHS